MKNLKERVNEQIEVLYGYELTEEQMDRIEVIGKKEKLTEKDFKELQKMEDDIVSNEEKVESSNTKVESFKWCKLKDYKPQLLKETTFDICKKGDIIVFHYSKNVLKNLVKINFGYEKEDGSVLDIDTVNFADNIDICKIVSINKQTGEIKCKSEYLGGIYYIYTDNFQNEIKNKVCCTDAGIPFKRYIKKSA